MPFQWLEMRIVEEKERRQREIRFQEALPRAFEDLHQHLAGCVDAYNQAFGAGAAALTLQNQALHLRVREPRGEMHISAVPALPGFQVDREGATLVIEIGLLPDDKLTYQDREKNEYLTLEEMTRRILDRVLFPKLKD
jgi:hypothetical protein